VSSSMSEFRIVGLRELCGDKSPLHQHTGTTLTPETTFVTMLRFRRWNGQILLWVNLSTGSGDNGQYDEILWRRKTVWV
jgi:hypothetical protein